MAHLLVDTRQAHQGAGIARIDIERLLKFLEGEIVFAQSRLELTQSDVHGRKMIVDLHGRPTISENLIGPHPMMIQKKISAITLPASPRPPGKPTLPPPVRLSTVRHPLP